MSRFVSGGTLDAPIDRDDEWRKAQQELEENRKRREEESGQEGGKSLYEVLQANKAAKQEAFEEATRLKNQFRALDDDEAEFLDSVLESTRAKEAAIRKETTEQLEVFRKHQEQAEKAALTGDTNDDTGENEEQWAMAGRKRKKGKDKEPLKGVKLRKSSSTSEHVTNRTAAEKSPPSNIGKPAVQTQVNSGSTKAAISASKVKSPSAASVSASPQPHPPKPTLLGLANYSSDDDD